MGELIILPLQLTVAAGTSGTHDIAVAPEGRKLVLRKVTIAFPSGSEGYLGIAVKYGARNIIPDSGYITGDDQKFEFTKTWTYEAGSPVKIAYNNTDSSYSHTAFIIVELEMEEV
ncbi:hypothetical protein DRJ16_05010 [Candidatus Woesearchaeota archaeon]|nr:MAG: hypothetical protein DRJ16_05010 [Candidatus Woesearchaeota archaeon]